MTDTHLHANHTHQHGPGCGHTAIVHGGHVDYLHDGHLHHMRSDGTVEEHTISVDNTNPGGCVGKINHGEHQHGPDCGHEAIPHGDHTDYLVEGHLHHPHGDHCDDHGPVEVVGSQGRAA
jgi:hypothetical protein